MVRKKILLVDDTRTALMWEQMILHHAPYDLITASSGQEAVVKAAAERPDLILMDVQMPGMNGLEACQRLRSMPETKDIPIMLVTVEGDAAKVKAGLEAGCNDYITKPVNAAELLTKLRKHLEG